VAALFADNAGVQVNVTPSDDANDYYDTLQISVTAEPETVHRVYRLLAQRYHPDNGATGDAERFRALTAAYQTLSDPERRAAYDVLHSGKLGHRVQLANAVRESQNDFDMERFARAGVLQVLYTKRRLEPETPEVSPLELEQMLGLPREHLQFTTWFLAQKKLVARSDNSSLVITVDGIEYLEQHQQDVQLRRRLTSGSSAA
jgi:curved DNA-binding protein